MLLFTVVLYCSPVFSVWLFGKGLCDYTLLGWSLRLSLVTCWHGLLLVHRFVSDASVFYRIYRINLIHSRVQNVFVVFFPTISDFFLLGANVLNAVDAVSLQTGDLFLFIPTWDMVFFVRVAWDLWDPIAVSLVSWVVFSLTFSINEANFDFFVLRVTDFVLIALLLFSGLFLLLSLIYATLNITRIFCQLVKGVIRVLQNLSPLEVLVRFVSLSKLNMSLLMNFPSIFSFNFFSNYW